MGFHIVAWIAKAASERCTVEFDHAALKSLAKLLLGSPPQHKRSPVEAKLKAAKPGLEAVWYANRTLAV